MSGEVLIDHIQFKRDDERGEDGAVWYLILAEPAENVVCPTHPGRRHHFERQPFVRGGPAHRPGATAQEIAENKANIWGWDGNVDAPTVLPSFLAAEGRPYRLHSHLRGGQLDLCGDSTVTLSSASPCMMRDREAGAPLSVQRPSDHE